MLAIRKSKDEISGSHCTPNLLPCKIHHDGPVNATERYWKPEELPGTEGQKQAYFRGRKLCGREVQLPKGYEGAVLKISENPEPQPPKPEANGRLEDLEDDGDLMDDKEPIEIKAVTPMSRFDAFTVWGYEVLPDSAEEPFGRGVEEWIKLAEAIHSRPQETQAGGQ